MHTTAESFKTLFEKIHVRYGYDFTNYAEESLVRRSTLFMNNLKIDSWDDLTSLVLDNESTFEEFIKYISVTVTEMFRDPSFYLKLREKVLPILETLPVVKVWVAGCATGEEAYSVAILLKEKNLLGRSIIYATDINQKSLHIAKEGIYPISAIKTYTVNYIKSGGERAFSEYYTAKYDLTTFDQSLRNHIVFAPHNLAVDEAFNEFQIIVCRNVLIYFNPTLQERVINLFYESLSPSGFLALGSKESLVFSTRRECFQEVDRREKIYIKSEGRRMGDRVLSC
jgi:chemotaxis protein methyltransferase CheR